MNIGAIGGAASGAVAQSGQAVHNFGNSDSTKMSNTSSVDSSHKPPLSQSAIDLISAVMLSSDDSKKDESSLALALKMYSAAMICATSPAAGASAGPSGGAGCVGGVVA